MSYEKIPYSIACGMTVLQTCRKSKKRVSMRRMLPGNVIVVHGVNDVGTSYQAIEEGLCAGLTMRLFRDFTSAKYSSPSFADGEKLVADPDALYYKRIIGPSTDSPIIPFYWGFRELDSEIRTKNGQMTDRNGNRLDKDLSKGGGPFGNATSSIPDMWNRGLCAPVDVSGDPIRPLKTGPGRMYMILAAKRLAALISAIRDYDEGEVVSIVAHSQGCLLSLLAQAMLMEQQLRPADTLILTHPPYSLEEEIGILIQGANMLDGGVDSAMLPHYHKINSAQTLHGRLQTLVNIVRGVVDQPSPKSSPEFSKLADADHGGMVDKKWKAAADRDNRGKVYLYFCPEDMTVALDGIKGIGWQGVPDHIAGTEFKNEPEMLRSFSTGKLVSTGTHRLVPRAVTRQPMLELGRGFYQRVFTSKKRLNIQTKKIGPVLVGAQPHDFALRLKGEDDFAHAADAVRKLRTHHPAVAWPIDSKSSPVEQRIGIRTINGEPLNKPVLPDLGAQIRPEELPDTASQANLPANKQGPWETVCPIDAAIAVSTGAGLLRWQEARPHPSGAKRYTATPLELPKPELTKLNLDYNTEKGLHLKSNEDQRTVFRATLYPGGELIAHIQESPNEARLRWQHEVSAKSFHGSIIGSSSNHRGVTAYDLAIGRGTASSHPLFYEYLCAIADWRMKKSPGTGKLRSGVGRWEDFVSNYKVYWKTEADWRKKVIEGNAIYYGSGVLPIGLPVVDGDLWRIVISETLIGRRAVEEKKIP